MDLPEVVREALDDESVAARVSLGGDDALLVTPSRTLVYRSEGLLSDESVSEYPHGAERIEIDRGRRKSTVHLDYGLDGERELELPTDRLEDALHPVLAGVLNSAGVTESGEAIKDTFLFSELTVVITSERLVHHVGETVWDGNFEEFRYDDVTDLRFEEGDVATAVVVRLESGQERFKVPNDRARELREHLVEAVLEHHGYETLGSFREARTPEDEERGGTVDFGDGPDPLEANPPSGGRTNHDDVATASSSEEADTAGVDRVEAGDASEPASETDADAEEARDGEPATASRSDADDFDGSGFESAGPVDRELIEELAALREAVEEQNELLRAHGERIERQEERIERQGDRLDAQTERVDEQSEQIERQSDLFEQLIDELRRGR